MTDFQNNFQEILNGKFQFLAPTYFAFGKDRENDAEQLVKRFGGSKVLVHFGGGSVIRSGLLDRVEKSLEKEAIPYFELGGVQPNLGSLFLYHFKFSKYF